MPASSRLVSGLTCWATADRGGMMGGVKLVASEYGIDIYGGDVIVCCDILVPALSMRDFYRRAVECGYQLTHEDKLRVAEAVAAWVKTMLSRGYSIWQILCIERPEGRRADGSRV